MELLSTSDFLIMGGGVEYWFSDEDSLHGGSNQDFLQDFWGFPPELGRGSSHGEIRVYF